MNKKTIFIIGAGQLGSRHLQALKKLEFHCEIYVIDPAKDSLQRAQDRYNEVPFGSSHEVSYCTKIPTVNNDVDLAIIATNSDSRKDVIVSLLANNTVKNFILEKLLFNKKIDYFSVHDLLERRRCNTWVNCCFRTMPFYYGLRDYSNTTKYRYSIFGSKFGLITNSIHYIDYLSFLCGKTEFNLITELLEKEIINSKRKGYLELNGTLIARFVDGSVCSISCLDTGDVPLTVEVFNEEFRLISRETEKKGWISFKSSGWIWKEIDVDIPYQSQLTTDVARKILLEGSCDLPTYEESMKMHLILLDGVQDYLLKNTTYSSDMYPFT